MFRVGYILSPGPNLGGAEIYVAELAQGMQTYTDCSTRVYFSHNPSTGDELARRGVPNQWLGGSLQEGVETLRRRIESDGIQIVHANGYHSNFLIQFLLHRYPDIRRRLHLCCTEHGWIQVNPYERFKTRYDLKSLRLFDQVFVVAPPMKKKLNEECGLHNVVHIPSFIRAEYQDYVTAPKRPTIEPRLILGVGRLSPEKRFDKWLRVAARLLELDSRFRFVLLGEGEERPRLERLRDELGLNARLSLPGFTENPRPLYELAEYLLITSNSEGCPLVALEAMTTETLVISSRVGGLKALLSDGRGVTFPATESPDTIARLVMKTDRAPAARKIAIRQRARRHIAEHHLVRQAAEAYVNEYRKHASWR